MNCCNNGSCDMPTPMPISPDYMGSGIQGPGPALPNPSMPFYANRFPVGMGYVPMQKWQQTYPLEQAYYRGTIFPDLDYPFMRGRCR